MDTVVEVVTVQIYVVSDNTVIPRFVHEIGKIIQFCAYSVA